MINVKSLKQRMILYIPVIAAILVSFIFFTVWYFLQPCHIKNANLIVDNATIKVFGTESNGKQVLSRQEAIFFISEVFHALKRPGFKEIETINQAVNQALNNKMLQGDGSGLHLERFATKQELFVFISRGLQLPLNGIENAPLLYQDATLIDDWALPYISSLVNSHYLSGSEAGGLLTPKDYVTISESRKILDYIVNVITAPQTPWQFICYQFKHNSIIALPCAIFPIIVGTVLPLYDRIKSFAEKKRREDSIHGTICLAGCMKVGKTTFKTKLENNSAPIYHLRRGIPPTRTEHIDPIRLVSNDGELLFDGTIIDIPGAYPARALQFMTDSNPNKVLLLILAHTAECSGSKIDDYFIEEQFQDIKRTWVPALQAHGKTLRKIIIFINKTDLLPPEFGYIQENIYNRHVKLLLDAVSNPKLFHVIEGSSLTGKGMDELYVALRPDV